MRPESEMYCWQCHGLPSDCSFSPNPNTQLCWDLQGPFKWWHILGVSGKTDETALPNCVLSFSWKTGWRGEGKGGARTANILTTTTTATATTKLSLLNINFSHYAIKKKKFQLKISSTVIYIVCSVVAADVVVTVVNVAMETDSLFSTDP